MKRNRCVWKVMLALFTAAIIPLLMIGCSEGGEKQSKPEQPAKSEHPTKSEHPAKKEAGSSTKQPEQPEHPE